MIEFFKSAKFKGIVATILICILVPLYSYFVSDTVVTRITDAQMTMVDGKFMIATEYKPLVNSDANYRFKFDSGNHPERGHPAERQTGQDLEVRLAHPDSLHVRKRGEDRGSEVADGPIGNGKMNATRDKRAAPISRPCPLFTDAYRHRASPNIAGIRSASQRGSAGRNP